VLSYASVTNTGPTVLTGDIGTTGTCKPILIYLVIWKAKTSRVLFVSLHLHPVAVGYRASNASFQCAGIQGTFRKETDWLIEIVPEIEGQSIKQNCLRPLNLRQVVVHSDSVLRYEFRQPIVFHMFSALLFISKPPTPTLTSHSHTLTVV
jgi:hypothetical protein